MFKRLIGGLTDVVQSATTSGGGQKIPEMMSGRRTPEPAELDLSGLNAEERAKILAVVEKAETHLLTPTDATSHRIDLERKSPDSAHKSESSISISSSNFSDRPIFSLSRGPPTSDMDLSGLSDEEKSKILSVMQKADEDFPQIYPSKPEMESRNKSGDLVSSLTTIQPPFVGGGTTSPWEVSGSKRMDVSAGGQQSFAIITNKENTMTGFSASTIEQQSFRSTSTKWSAEKIITTTTVETSKQPRVTEVHLTKEVDVDLSGLTSEEREQILSVMAKADNLPYSTTITSYQNFPQSMKDDKEFSVTTSNVRKEKKLAAISSSSSSPLEIDLSSFSDLEREKILSVMHEAEMDIAEKVEPEVLIHHRSDVKKFDSFPKLHPDEKISPFVQSPLPDLDLTGLSEEEKRQIMLVMQKAEETVPPEIQTQNVFAKPHISKKSDSTFTMKSTLPSPMTSASPSMQDLDLSNLSESEKEQILSVMHKAEKDVVSHEMPKENKFFKPTVPKELNVDNYSISTPDIISPFLSPSISDMDLSNLTEAEQQKILSVMQKAEEILPHEINHEEFGKPSSSRKPDFKETLKKPVAVSPMMSPSTSELDLSHLSESEQQQIMSVMQKADEITPSAIQKQDTFVPPTELKKSATTDQSFLSKPYGLPPQSSPSMQDMDLSGLSEAEQEKILSVMQKAEDIDIAILPSQKPTIAKFDSFTKQPKSSRDQSPLLTPSMQDLDFSGLSDEERAQILSVMDKSEDIQPPSFEQKHITKPTFVETIPTLPGSKIEKPSPATPAPVTGVDMTGLSKEEQEKILSVMAKAEAESVPQEKSLFSKTFGFAPKLFGSNAGPSSLAALTKIRDTVSSVTTELTHTLENKMQVSDYEPLAVKTQGLEKNFDTALATEQKVQEKQPEYYDEKEFEGDITRYEQEEGRYSPEYYDDREFERDTANYQQDEEINEGAESFASDETEGADEGGASFDENEIEEEQVDLTHTIGGVYQDQHAEKLMNDIDLDLSGLSEEERQHILMVMSRASESEFTSVKPLPQTQAVNDRHRSYSGSESEELQSRSGPSNMSYEEEEFAVRRSVPQRRSSSKAESLPVIEEPEDLEEEMYEEMEHGLRYQYSQKPDDYSQTAVPIVVHPPSPPMSDEEKEFYETEAYPKETSANEYNDEMQLQRDDSQYSDYSMEDNSTGSQPDWNPDNPYVTESFTAQIRTSFDLADEEDSSSYKFSPVRTPEEQDVCIEAEESFSAPLRQSIDIEDEENQYVTNVSEYDEHQQIDYEPNKYEQDFASDMSISYDASNAMSINRASALYEEGDIGNANEMDLYSSDKDYYQNQADTVDNYDYNAVADYTDHYQEPGELESYSQQFPNYEPSAELDSYAQDYSSYREPTEQADYSLEQQQEDYVQDYTTYQEPPEQEDYSLQQQQNYGQDYSTYQEPTEQEHYGEDYSSYQEPSTKEDYALQQQNAPYEQQQENYENYSSYQEEPTEQQDYTLKQQLAPFDDYDRYVSPEDDSYSQHYSKKAYDGYEGEGESAEWSATQKLSSTNYTDMETSNLDVSMQSEYYSSTTDSEYQNYYQDNQNYSVEQQQQQQQQQQLQQPYEENYSVPQVEGSKSYQVEERKETTVPVPNQTDAQNYFESDASEELPDKNVEFDSNYYYKPDSEASTYQDYISNFNAIPQFDTSEISSAYVESEITSYISVSNEQKQNVDSTVEFDSGTSSADRSFMVDEAEVPDSNFADTNQQYASENIEFLNNEVYSEIEKFTAPARVEEKRRSDSQSTEGPDESEFQEDFSPTDESRQDFPEPYREEEQKVVPIQQKELPQGFQEQKPATDLSSNVRTQMDKKISDPHTFDTSQAVAKTGTENMYSDPVYQQAPMKPVPKAETIGVTQKYDQPVKLVHQPLQPKPEEKSSKQQQSKSSSFFGGSSILNVKKFDFGGISSAIKSQTEQVIKKASSTNINALISAPTTPATSRRSSLVETPKDDYGIDLAGLSAEEREHILSVMAKANEATIPSPLISAPTAPVVSKANVESSIEVRTVEISLQDVQEDKIPSMVGFGVSYGSESSHETEDTGYASRNSPFEDEGYEFSHEPSFPVIQIPETIVEAKQWTEETYNEPPSEPVPAEVPYQRSAATYNPFLTDMESGSKAKPAQEISIPGMPELDLSQFNEEERQHLLAMFYKANEMEHEIVENVKQVQRPTNPPPQLSYLEHPIPVIREIQPTPDAVVDYIDQFEQRYVDESVTGSFESTGKAADELGAQLQQYDSSEVSSDINDDEEQQKRIRDIEAELAEQVPEPSEIQEQKCKAELCPLCMTTLLQYTVDGQNVTGQACFYCNTVVCVNCGQVHNFSSHSSIWLCRLCQPQLETEKSATTTGLELIEMKSDGRIPTSTIVQQTTFQYSQPSTIISTNQIEIPEMEVIDTSPEDNYYTTTSKSKPVYPSTTISYDNVLTPRKKLREDGDSDDSDEETSSTSDDDYPDEVIEVPSEPSTLRQSRNELERETESESALEAVGGDVLAEIAKTFSSSMADVDFDVSPRAKSSISTTAVSSNYISTNPFSQGPVHPPPIPARSQTSQPLPPPAICISQPPTSVAVPSSYTVDTPITVINLDHEPQAPKIRAPKTTPAYPIEEEQTTGQPEQGDNPDEVKVEEDDIDYTQALKYYNSQPFYTHRSGPVYTIPEDEEEPEEVAPNEEIEPVRDRDERPRLTLLSPEEEVEELSPSPVSPAAVSPTPTSGAVSTEVSPTSGVSPAEIISGSSVTRVALSSSSLSFSSSFSISSSTPSYSATSFDIIGDQSPFQTTLPYFPGSRSGGQLIRDVTSLVSSQYYFNQKAQTEQHLASVTASSSSSLTAILKTEPRPIRAAPPPPPPPPPLYTANDSSATNFDASFAYSTFVQNVAYKSSVAKESVAADSSTLSVGLETSKNIIYATPHVQYTSATLEALTAGSGGRKPTATKPRGAYVDWSATGDLSPIHDSTQWGEQNELDSASEGSSYDNLKKFDRSSTDNTTAGRIETLEEERDRFVSRLKRSPAMILHSGEEQQQRRPATAAADRRGVDPNVSGHIRFKNPFLIDTSFAEIPVQESNNPTSHYGQKDEQPHRASEMGRRRLPNIPQTAAPFQQQNPPVDDTYASSRWRERLQETSTDPFSGGSGGGGGGVAVGGASWKSPSSTDQRQRLVQTGGTLKMPATLARVLLKQELREALSRRMQQLEASEIEANQRQYAIQRHILTGVYPRSVGLDSAPAQVKCTLPPELVEGCRIELRKPISSTMLGGGGGISKTTPKSPRRTAQFGFLAGDSGVSGGTTSIGTQFGMPSSSSSSSSKYIKTGAEWERSSTTAAKNLEWERTYNKPPTVAEWERTPWTSTGTTTTKKSWNSRDAETQTSASGFIFSSEQMIPTYQKYSTSWTETDLATGGSYRGVVGGLYGRSSVLTTPKTPTKSVSTNTEKEDPFSLRDADLAARKARKLRSRRMTSNTYFSDDDDSTSREMRKSKIREEIARRREKLSGLSNSTDFRDFYRPSDYSSHVPHYGSLPRIDFPQMPGEFDRSYNSLPRYPTWSSVDTTGGPLQPYHKIHPMYHSDLGYLSDVQDYGRSPLADYRTRPLYTQGPYSQRYLSRSLPYLDQLDRYYSADVPQMSSANRPPPVAPQQLPESGLLSHYANYLNEQFLNRPTTSNDYAWGTNQQQPVGQRYPPSYSSGVYEPMYTSRVLVPPQPQQPVPAHQSWMHRPAVTSANQYRPYSAAPQYYSLPSQQTAPPYQYGRTGMQDPTVSSSAWPQSSWQPSSSLGQAGMRTSLSSWRQSQPPYDSLLNRNDSGYSSAGGYLSDSLGRTFRRRDYQGPTDINELYSGPLSNVKLHSSSGTTKGQQRQHLQPPTITVSSSNHTPGAITYNDNRPVNNNNYRYVQNYGAVKRILLTRDPKDRSVKGHGLGMKVIGGKILPSGDGELGAYVAAVYKGGLVDTMGEVKEGDQILEWNGIPLTGKTYEEVQRIIDSSEGEVEIVVRTGANLNQVYELEKQSKSVDKGYESGSGVQVGGGVTGVDVNHMGVNALASLYQILDGKASPCFSTTPRSGSPLQTDDNATGHLRTRISFDDETGTLFVTVIAARDLRARCHIRSGYPNPFVKIYLLPPRRVENKRRTKFIQSTCNPEWNQTVVYKDLNRSHLFSSYLEFTVWDYDRFESNEFLGQVVLSLSDPSVLCSRARWYPLQPRVQPQQYYPYSNYYYEPPSLWQSATFPVRSYSDTFQNVFRRNELMYDDLLLQIQST